jgi:outer membrane immunogenic protein
MIRLFRIAQTSLAFVGIFAGTAFAADLPNTKEPLAPLPIPFTWTGFYLGGHAGYGWGSKTFLDNYPTPDLELDADTGFGGGVGGLQAGYNYQYNWLVIGAEGDFTWSGAQHSSFGCFTFGNQICSAHPEWVSTITGRIGIAPPPASFFGPSLFYVKGGVAWANDSFTDVATKAGYRDGVPAVPGDVFVANQIRAGWTVGGGIEYAFAPNWSIFAEYDYFRFNARSVPFTDGGSGFFTEEIHQTMNMATIGLNYRFSSAGTHPSGFLADTAITGSPSDDGPAKHVLAYTGIDVAKFSIDGWVGGIIAPLTDIDTSGLRALIEAGGGAYKYYGTGITYHGVSETGSALAGYGFEGNNYSITLMAGVNAENDTLSSPDPTNAVVGTQFGGMVRGEAWYNPTPQTLVYTEDQFSSAFHTFYTEGKLGYDITNGNHIFVGPALGYLGNERFTQFRAGAHVTQIEFNKIEVDLSGGYANDSVVGPGVFGKIEVSTNF